MSPIRALLIAAILCAAAAPAAAWELDPVDAAELESYIEGEYRLPSYFLDRASPTKIREGARWRFEVQDGDSKRVITWQLTRDVALGQSLFEIDNGRGLVFAFVSDNTQLAIKGWIGKRGGTPEEINLYPGFVGDTSFTSYFLKVPLNASVIDMPAEAARRSRFNIGGKSRDVVTKVVRYLGVSYELTTAPLNEVVCAFGLLEFKVQGNTVGKLVGAQAGGEVAPLLDWSGIFDIPEKPEPFEPPPRPTRRIITEDLGAAGTLVHVHELLGRVNFRDSKGKITHPYGEPEYAPRPVSFPGHIVTPPGVTWEFWSGYRPGAANTYELISQLRPFVSRLYLDSVPAEEIPGIARMDWLTSLKLGLKRTQGKRGYLSPLKALQGLAELELWNVDAIADLGWLEQLPKLEKLWLQGENAEIGLPRVPNMPGLRELYFGWTHLTDETVAALSTLGGLEKLSLNDCDFRFLTDAGKLRPKTLKRLEILGGKDFSVNTLALLLPPCVDELCVNGFDLNNDHIAVISCYPGLKVLELGVLAEADDDGLAMIAEMSKLEKLELFLLPNVSDAGLAQLKACANLKELRLDDWGPGVTGAFLSELKQNLEKAYLRGIFRTGKPLESLLSMTALRELTIYSCVGGVELGSDLGRVLAPLKELTVLNLVGIGVANNETLGSLKGASGLKELRVCYAGALTERGLEALTGLAKLESLVIQQCRGVSYLSTPTLKRLSSLRKLLVLKCGDFGDRDITDIRAALPRCECEILR
ncbi:MAG: hypothetical protein IT462_14740 [Planctomycetes bacterium]|nr:hypothetical protein [Planctomycetota bacterium]